MKPTHKDALSIFVRIRSTFVSRAVFVAEHNGKQEKTEKVLQQIRIRNIPARPDVG
jgi:hypothetical protein